MVKFSVLLFSHQSQVIGKESPLLDTALEIHDRRQFEMKLDYQPSGTDPRSEYMVDTWLFLPRSLNVNQETWPREGFYADLHNYVRLKTPVLSFEQVLNLARSPLRQLEERVSAGALGAESEVIYDAKMLSCVYRGALRRFARQTRKNCAALAQEGIADANDAALRELEQSNDHAVGASEEILRRYRIVIETLSGKHAMSERSRAALRLVDEYMSLCAEQYFRRIVVGMNRMPKTEQLDRLRRQLMNLIVEDEAYRKTHAFGSVLHPDSDNEEYTHRIGFLKKFCMNILFLKVQRSSPKKAWEEVLFAVAAGGSMAFALGVGLVAQSRYPQASFNFFVLAVFGYMLKDRIKDALRRFFSSYAGRFLYERRTTIRDPVTQAEVGVCQERIDFDALRSVPPEVLSVRGKDDLFTAAQGELSESVIRYRKKISLESEMLPNLGDGMVSGVTDIIRLNVDTWLRDMDDPEYAIDYVDLEDFSVGQVKAAKSYRVDMAFRFFVDDGRRRETTLRLIRLVVDRNGLKRMAVLKEGLCS
jgi:hypothetical protein